MNAITNVIDVTDANFEQVVIEGSKDRPVVVDLWAEWCGPCKTLGPILEKVAGERAGAFLLAKLDVDANPMVAGAFVYETGCASMAGLSSRNSYRRCEPAAKA